MRLSIRESATFDWRRFPQARLPLIGAGVILVFVLLAAFAPFIVSDPTEIEMRREQDGETITPPFAPNPRNLFGTDQLGRDILARVVFGLRTSLIVGLLVRGLSMAAGVMLGLISGYFPKTVDDVIMRVTDIMLAFPVILLAMTVTAVLGPGLLTVCLALALVAWPDVARLVRGQVLAIREQTYVEAARSIGAGNWRILLRHVLPNCMGPIIVAFSMGIPGAIMYEAGLSFFGFGIQPPTPSLGSIISDGRGYITVAPWYPGFPGLALTLLVLSVNLVGDGLIDVMNPRGAKGSRNGHSAN